MGGGGGLIYCNWKCAGVLPHSILLPSLQDPTKDGEERIKADFAELNEKLLEAFRKLEEA